MHRPRAITDRGAPWLAPAVVLFAVLFAVLGSGSVAQEVTLPLARYDELRALAEPAPEAEPEPVVPVAYERAVLAITVGSTTARIVQELTVAVFGDDWRNLPMADAGSFVDADFGGVDGRLDGSTIRLRGAGRHRLRLTSVVPVVRDQTATRATWQLSLRVPRAALVSGTVETPPGIEEVVASGAIVAASPSPASGAAASADRRWALVAEPGAEVSLALYGTQAVPERESLPLAFEATSAMALEVSRSRRRARTWLEARVRQGRLERLAIPIPEGYEVIDVGGDAIAGWHVDGTNGNLVVMPPAPISDRLSLEIELAAGAATELDGPTLYPDGAAAVLAASKVYVRGDGLLQLIDPGAGRRPDSRQQAELPAPFRSAPGMALVLPAPGTTARWQITWAEATEVLAAQVDRLLIKVLAGNAGRAGYQVWAEVRNRGGAHLAFELPAGTELLAAERDGRRVEPGRSSGAWTVPLGAGDDRQVIYFSSLLPLELPAADGRLEVPLPVLSAPVGRVEVSVLLPGGRGLAGGRQTRRYELADAGRRGTVASPPVPRPGAGASAGAWMRGGTAGIEAMDRPAPWPRPPGFQRVDAAWSALSTSPAPLGIRVISDNDKQGWL